MYLILVKFYDSLNHTRTFSQTFKISIKAVKKEENLYVPQLKKRFSFISYRSYTWWRLKNGSSRIVICTLKRCSVIWTKFGMLLIIAKVVENIIPGVWFIKVNIISPKIGFTKIVNSNIHFVKCFHSIKN